MAVLAHQHPAEIFCTLGKDLKGLSEKFIRVRGVANILCIQRKDDHDSFLVSLDKTEHQNFKSI